jgi:hypothetical protein
VVFGSAYAGRERQLASEDPNVGYDLWGVRVGAQCALAVAGGYSQAERSRERDYGGRSPSFSDRRDRQTDLGIGVSYCCAPTIDRGCPGRLHGYRSNIPITVFDRTVAGFSVRFTF